MGLNVTWLGTIWGLSIGILVADLLYYLTDNPVMLILIVPFPIVGHILGKRYQRKLEAEGDPFRKHI